VNNHIPFFHVHGINLYLNDIKWDVVAVEPVNLTGVKVTEVAVRVDVTE